MKAEKSTQKNTSNGWLEILIVIAGFILAFLLRYSLRDFQNDDYRAYTGPWYDFIRQHGGLSALKFPFSNYTPPYLYLMVIASSLLGATPKLYAIKLISVIFDLIASVFIFKIVRFRYPTGRVPLIATLSFLFLPTVFLNSAFWGQADGIYTTGLLACVYFLLCERPIPALIAFGLAISIKLQAIFLFPLLIILLLKKKIHWATFLLIPGMYLLLIIPAWAVGRPLPDLLTIYLAQGETYRSLTMNAPNLYTWLPNELYDTLLPFGFAGAALVISAFILLASHRKLVLQKSTILQLALISTLIMPYFIPKMHDRYFYPADVFSLIFGFYFPRWFFIPLMVQFVSLFSYFPFLFRFEPVPLPFLAVVALLALGLLIRHLFTPQPESLSTETEFA